MLVPRSEVSQPFPGCGLSRIQLLPLSSQPNRDLLVSKADVFKDIIQKLQDSQLLLKSHLL